MSDSSQGLTIAVGSDHAGLEARHELIRGLCDRGHEVLDLGTETSASCDYPDFAKAVAAAVTAGKARFGVLVCGTGQGMVMTANRLPGIRAGLVFDEFSARMIRAHNDANIICFGARIQAVAAMERLLEIFVATEFEGGRHQRRVNKIMGAS